MRPDWYPNWSGERCVIIASGPSATREAIYLAQGRAKVLAINNSWHLAPWADALYASDAAWWQTGKGDEFSGLKVSRSEHPGVKQVRLVKENGEWVNRLLLDQPGVIGAGGSSGFQALNLALQFGARSIALVGYDARTDLGSHWHGDHADGLKNPKKVTADLWMRCLDEAAPALFEVEADVVNCSPVSAVTAFRKTRLAEWLA